MKRFYGRLYVLAITSILLAFSAAHAGITITGDVTPNNASDWNSSAYAYIGKTDTGTMEVSHHNQILSAYAYLGHDEGASGEMTVSGVNTAWVNHYDLIVGKEGSGTLNITDGAEVHDLEGIMAEGHRTYPPPATATATATVDGTGSLWRHANSFTVGEYGSATLTIDNGGLVQNKVAYIGKERYSTGSVTVNGPSTWENYYSLYVGYTGNGTLDITGGAQVTSGTDDTYHTSTPAVIGYKNFSTGAATVDGAGSSWTSMDSHLTVGFSGEGTLAITNGGVVNSIRGSLAEYDASSALVTIDGTGSKWVISESLSVGHHDDGTLNVTNGGLLSNTRSCVGLTKGVYNRGIGVVTISDPGSLWTNTDGICVGLNSGQGTVNILNGGKVTASGSDSYLGELCSYGPTSGVINVDGLNSTFNNNTNLYVGKDGTGTLNITGGGLVTVSGTLTIDENDDDDSFINMKTGGKLAIYGEADSSLTSFLALVEGTNAIRYWDDSASDWDDLTNATYGTDYTLSYTTEGDLANYTLLTVGTPPTPDAPGDANGDNCVDGSDVTILANNWQYGVGMEEPDATWAMGDFNGDGKVDGSDVTILANNWQYGVTTAADAVPEPGCIALLTILLAAGLAPAFRRRTR